MPASLLAPYMKPSILNSLRVSAAIILLIAAVPAVPAADTNATTSATNRIDEANPQEVLRSYLQLQEQLHATQLAIELNRKQADQAAAQNAEALANRLRTIEEAIASQRAREMETMQSSNRVMLIVAGTFASLGFLAMLVMTYFQWRTVGRLAEISAMPGGRGLNGPSPLGALEAGHGPLVTVSPSDEPGVRLLGAIDRLEKRIYELEHTNPIAVPESAPIPNGARSTATIKEGEAEMDAMLGRGQSLLNLDRAEEALACFNEALEQSPNHAEALVKKGIALERLRRLDEALEHYDRAIASDRSFTMAYLYKAGLFNRMERYTEALACYDQALRAQEKADA